jgi:hypothetical protein
MINIKVGQKVNVLEISNITYNIGRYYNLSVKGNNYLNLTYEDDINKFDVIFANTNYFSEKDSILINEVLMNEFNSNALTNVECLDCNELYILKIQRKFFRLKISKEFITKINW